MTGLQHAEYIRVCLTLFTLASEARSYGAAPLPATSLTTCSHGSFLSANPLLPPTLDARNNEQLSHPHQRSRRPSNDSKFHEIPPRSIVMQSHFWSSGSSCRHLQSSWEHFVSTRSHECLGRNVCFTFTPSSLKVKCLCTSSTSCAASATALSKPDGSLDGKSNSGTTRYCSIGSSIWALS